MKRSVICTLFLIFALAINIFSAIWVNGVFNDMSDELGGAYADMRAGDDKSTNEKLENFTEILERNDRCLALFVRRDHLNTLAQNASTMRAYSKADHKEDFCAEAARTIETVRTVRRSMFEVS